jgi:hypothetical protein
MPMTSGEFPTNVFDSKTELFWAGIGMMLLIGIPFLMLLYKGIRLLFNIKTRNKTLNGIAASIWFIGVIICSILFFELLSDNSTKSVVRTEENITQPTGDILYIDATNMVYNKIVHGKWHVNFIGIGFNNYSEGTMGSGNIDLRIEKSAGDKFELIKLRSARGKSSKDATNEANMINASIVQNDSLLTIPSEYKLDGKQRFKFQNLTYVLKVPPGKSIYLKPSTKYILDDIDNVTDTKDEDMVNKEWRMTQLGLKCVSCKGW